MSQPLESPGADNRTRSNSSRSYAFLQPVSFIFNESLQSLGCPPWVTDFGSMRNWSLIRISETNIVSFFLFFWVCCVSGKYKYSKIEPCVHLQYCWQGDLSVCDLQSLIQFPGLSTRPNEINESLGSAWMILQVPVVPLRFLFVSPPD